MLKKYLSRFIYGACAVAALTSCGDSKANGTAEFATVFATAAGPSSDLDADVASLVDATTGAAVTVCAAGSVPIFTPTDATYTITSTPYAAANTGSSSSITPSALTVTKVTVTLTPADTVTPALPPIYQTRNPTSGQTILPGATQGITLRIVPNELKSFLAPQLVCTGVRFHYRASVSFEAVEVTTNRVHTITAPGFLLVNIVDFI